MSKNQVQFGNSSMGAKHIAVTFFLLVRFESYSQTPFAEIELNKPVIENLRGMVVGDSIFVTFTGKDDITNPRTNGYATSVPKQYFCWILPDGSVKKVMKDLNFLYLIIDEPFIGLDEQFKTTVIRLDLQSGSSSIKSFFEESKIHFVSTVFGNHVFRIGREKNIKLQIFDFNTGKMRTSMPLEFKSKTSDPVFYSRIGTNNTVYKGKTSKAVSMSSLRNYILVDSTNSGSLLLTIGTHATAQPSIPVVGAFGLIPVLLAGVANIAIRELNDGPSVDMYSYFEGAIGKGFNHISQTDLLFQQIDDYEIDQQSKKIRFDLKGYLDGKQETFTFYQERDSKKLKIMKFNRK